jgi:hypothetical protein
VCNRLQIVDTEWAEILIRPLTPKQHISCPHPILEHLPDRELTPPRRPYPPYYCLEVGSAAPLEKLAHDNHTIWKAQVVAALRGVQLYGFLDGASIKPAAQIKAKVGSDEEDVSNPVFMVWKAQEQKDFSYLLSSVSRDILVQIADLLTTAAVWKHLETSFASQSRA